MAKYINQEKLAEELSALGFARVEPLASLYFCPNREWLAGHGQYCRAHKKPPSGQARDCNYYARQGAVWAADAMVMLKEQTQTPEDAAACFGEATVTLSNFSRFLGNEKGGAHRTNIVRTDDEQWHFFEPQTGEWVGIQAALADGSVGACLVASV